jgi:anti-sigma factor RsiW
MNNCLDTGTIQAFLDGELMPAAASNVSAHIAMCDACAAQLGTAEEESAFVFSVLEREMDTLVPTQRLWSKINESIEVEKHNLPLWQKAWNVLVASLANPAIAVAAVAVIVFGWDKVSAGSSRATRNAACGSPQAIFAWDSASETTA